MIIKTRNTQWEFVCKKQINKKSSRAGSRLSRKNMKYRLPHGDFAERRMGKNKEICIVQWILDERDSLQGKFANLAKITREPNLTRTGAEKIGVWEHKLD